MPIGKSPTNHEYLAHGDDLGAAEHVGHDLGDHGGAHAAGVHHGAVAGVQDGLALCENGFYCQLKIVAFTSDI